MTTTNPGRLARRSRPWTLGPPVTFGAAVSMAFAALLLGTMTLSRDLVLPALSAMFFVLAGLVALLAWRWERAPAHGAVTYWDVAGALTLFGICAAAFVEPEQMVRLVAHRNQ